MLSRRNFIQLAAACGLTATLFPRQLFASEMIWVERARPLMGTIVAVAIKVPSDFDAQSLINQAFDYAQSAIKLFSDWEVSSLANQLRTEKDLPIGNDRGRFFQTLVGQALAVGKLSQGFYQPLSIELTELWRQARNDSSIPTKLDLKFALKAVQDSKVQLNPGKLVLQGSSGFDFNGIGKGFVADLLEEFFRSRGINTGRIACSGDLKCFGTENFLIEIEDPRPQHSASEILGSFQVNQPMGIATSGDYRNCWKVNQRSYHHLINPLTGLPGRECMQATVLHPSATLADALSTAVFFMSPNAGVRLIESIPQAAAVIVDRSHKVHATKGISKLNGTRLLHGNSI
ncbi:FAD:protein FMN transferase [bacterium]|nr:FAD:protein FMN transferase [bacterium]